MTHKSKSKLTLAGAYSRLALMARGEAWPADDADRAMVTRAIRTILDELNERRRGTIGDILDPFSEPPDDAKKEAS